MLFLCSEIGWGMLLLLLLLNLLLRLWQFLVRRIDSSETGFIIAGGFISVFLEQKKTYKVTLKIILFKLIKKCTEEMRISICNNYNVALHVIFILFTEFIHGLFRGILSRWHKPQQQNIIAIISLYCEMVFSRKS